MDLVLYIVFFGLLFIAWIEVLKIVLEKERRRSTKARFDEITKGLFGDDDHAAT